MLATLASGRGGRTLLAAIEDAIRDVNHSGFCATSWHRGSCAATPIATPIATAEGGYSLNVSVSTVDGLDSVVDALAAPLLDLCRRITEAW